MRTQNYAGFPLAGVACNLHQSLFVRSIYCWPLLVIAVVKRHQWVSRNRIQSQTRYGVLLIPVSPTTRIHSTIGCKLRSGEDNQQQLSWYPIYMSWQRMHVNRAMCMQRFRWPPDTGSALAQTDMIGRHVGALRMNNVNDGIANATEALHRTRRANYW